MIADDLAGTRIAVTGATGFLGTALVERLLRAVPDCELVLLIRAGRMRNVQQRAAREIFKNNCFDRLRDQLGGRDAFDAEVARRVQVIEGDVGTDGLGLTADGREVLATCDVVIHSAATVSFDSPLDLAVEVNLMGPTRIARTLTDLGVTPHLVAVSTCYVAGNRRGAAPEIPVDESPFWISDIDWRSIVRPAIIESAWAEPVPGWIRGFRMAEPVIISYARGLLKEFPGVPEGTVDVIPVDLVVGAIIGVAARGPSNADGSPDITQVASGSANPLKYERLVDLVQSWFAEHPLYDTEGQPIAVPDWGYTTRNKVQGQLERARSALEKTEKVIGALPLRGKQAEWSAKVEEQRDTVSRALTYVELYGAYTSCEAIYGVDRLLALQASLTGADADGFCMDPRVVDWDHYVHQIHLPSVVEHARVRTDGRKGRGESRADRLRRQVLSPDRQLAAFDLENTLIASNVVTSYAWLASRRLDRDDKLRLTAKLIGEAPGLLRMDRADRSDFLRSFYRRYEGAPVEQIREDSAEMLSQLILTKSFPAAIRRVREHRALGHRTVLITGALDFVVEPLKPLFDDIVSASLAVDDRGRYLGQMVDVPPTGESRASALFDYARLHDLDLAEAVAYADSSNDLPMLEVVGFPVAVNPETRLASLARKRGWLIEQWSKAPGFRPNPVPLAPRRTVTRPAPR